MILSDISIRRPVLATIVLLVVVILGAQSYVRLGVQLFPDIEFPAMAVVTTYLGAGPEEIERLISEPVEDALSTLDDVKYVQSTSAEGVSTVVVEFEMGTDVDIAANDVRDKVSLAERELPDDADKPTVLKFDPNAEPILRLAVSGDRSLAEVYELTDDKVRTVVQKVGGVASVDIIGGEDREIRVAVRQDRLDAYGIAIGQVIAAIGAANMEMPGGHVTRGAQEYAIRVLGEVHDLDDIRGIAIPGTRGAVRIRDVATVADTVAEVRKMARSAGKPSVGVLILKQGDANTIEVGRGVRAGIAELTAGVLPADMKVEIITDTSVFIRDVVDEVKANIWQGILLTALALYLFLHNWRGTFIAALAMPAAVVGTLVPLYFAGYSINIMSMMGLAISVGILVNNSILVLENIYRYIDMGFAPADAASKGTADIAVAVASTTLTNIVVFLPIAFMESIVGMVFRQFAMTVVFATVLSLLISFTLTPMMAALLLRSKAVEQARLSERRAAFYARWDGVYQRLAASYGRLVAGVVRHPWLTILLAVGVFALVIAVIVPLIGKEFFPRADEGEFAIVVETDVSSSLEYTDAVIRRVEEICAAHIPERERVFTSVGEVSGEHGATSAGVNVGEVVVKLSDKTDRDRSTQQVMDALRPLLAAVPGARFKLEARQMGGPGGGGIELEIRGEDIATLNAIARDAMTMLQGGSVKGRTYDPIAGAVDIDTDWRLGKQEVALRPKRERMRRLGVSIQTLAETVRAYYSGVVASEYREGDDEHDIRVLLSDEDRRSILGLCDCTVQGDGGRLVKLSEIVEPVRSIGPTQLSRKDREHMVKVKAGVTGRAESEVSDPLQKRLDAYPLPPGYRFSWGGEVEFRQREFPELANAAVLATVLTFLMLAGILESWRLPGLIMLSLPFSFAGVFLALFLRGLAINIFSLMGIVMLIGLVINNAIVIVDHVEAVRKEGVPLTEAIPRACAVRLRPILMANITTIVAMIPLALGIGAGGEYRAPMAIVQMGGMVGGGLLALVVTPAIYYLASRRRHEAA
ncbi:MAG: efflux RND transporter permease subunit [Kiritimatiellae bacterium]|nr:efflux RND transporter permease subunit [Kiritimatiellia bacterium]